MNDSGVVQNHKSYDAFGNVTAETNAAKDVPPLPELDPARRDSGLHSLALDSRLLN